MWSSFMGANMGCGGTSVKRDYQRFKVILDYSGRSKPTTETVSKKEKGKKSSIEKSDFRNVIYVP